MNAVREFRDASGLTQDQLAERSGVAQPNIAAYEAGRRRPSAAMLERLRHAAAPLPHDILRAHRADVLELADQHGLDDVRVFGSTARGTDTSGSDIDLLVAARKGTGLMAVTAFALAAEDLLGVEVDVVTEGGLRPDHPIRDAAVAL